MSVFTLCKLILMVGICRYNYPLVSFRCETRSYRLLKPIKSGYNMEILIILLILGSSYATIPNTSYIYYDGSYGNPEQIHIAYGNKTNKIVVTWSTFNDTQDNRVKYGVGILNKEMNGTQRLFTDGGSEKRSQWIHKVELEKLRYNTTYMYVVGSIYAWSDLLTFTTPPQGEDWPLRVLVYGDMGSENAHSLSFLEAEVQENEWHMIIHDGDFAYDMDSDNARVGDQFMRQIEPLASKVPYMTCPGNHEQAYNFSNYRYRFNMPGNAENIYYSFNIEKVHFVFFSTEVYYFQEYGFELIKYQYDWIENDLVEANTNGNRRIRPWIIAIGHRPMYCTNTDTDCNLNATRIGIDGKYGLENLFYMYGVDVLFWGHEHSYERTWPVYDTEVYNGSLSQPYVNPRAPVHIITGSAGCKEEHDPFKNSTQRWSAFRNSDYGYGRLIVYNDTHLYFEQVSVDKLENNRGTVIDDVWIVADKHGPFAM